jgi:hypothetical protein
VVVVGVETGVVVVGADDELELLLPLLEEAAPEGAWVPCGKSTSV